MEALDKETDRYVCKMSDGEPKAGGWRLETGVRSLVCVRACV